MKSDSCGAGAMNRNNSNFKWHVFLWNQIRGGRWTETIPILIDMFLWNQIRAGRWTETIPILNDMFFMKSDSCGAMVWNNSNFKWFVIPETTTQWFDITNVMQCCFGLPWCMLLKRVVCYFEEGGVVLWRGWCVTLKRVVWYFKEGGVSHWRGWCGTLRRVVCHIEEGGVVL